MSQIFLLAVSPVITRYYQPEQLGAYAFVLAIVSIFAPVINGRLDLSVVTAEDGRDVRNTIAASAFVAAIFTALIGIGLTMALSFSRDVFKGVNELVYFSLPLILLNGTLNILTSYNNRHKQYRLLATTSVERSVAQNIAQVAFGFSGVGTIGLFIAQIFSCIISVMRQGGQLIHDFRYLAGTKIGEITATIKKNYRQVLFSSPAILINSLSYSAITLFMNNLYGVQEIGYFSLSFRMLGLPLQLFSANIAQIFFQRASEEMKLKGDFRNSFKKTAIILAVISLPVFGLIMVSAEWIFEIVFGSGWSRAGLFAEILCPMYAIRLVVSALSLSMIVANKQTFEVLLQLLFLIELLTVYCLSIKLGFTVETFLESICVMYSVTYIMWFYYMIDVSKGKRKNEVIL